MWQIYSFLLTNEIFSQLFSIAPNKTTGDILEDISRGGVYVTRTRDPLRDRQVF